MRNKDWVEMVPMFGAPDVDAIAAKFFMAKGKSKVIQFQSKGHVEVYLELPHDKYLETMVHLENDDSESESVQPVKRLVCCNHSLATYPADCKLY
jgi:hypothetical protein